MNQACLFNFIIYTEDASQLEYLQKLASMINGRYPSKIILIFADSSCQEDRLEIDQSLSRIKLTVSGKHLHEVELLTLPILRPDYPIYTLWSGNPNSNHINLDFFKNISSRLIFDSETSDDLLDFTERMQQEFKKTALDIVDITWTKVLGWRMILTEVIDTKERVMLLEEADRFHLSFATENHSLFHHDSIQTLYLLAWICSCLGWEFKTINWNNDKIILLFHDKNKEIHVELIPEQRQKIPVGSILSFEAYAKGEQRVYIARKEDSAQVLVHLSSHDICDLPFTLYLPNLHKGSSYLTQLLFAKSSPHYVKMLKILSKILAA